MNNGQYLKEVQKAFEKDTTALGKVWRLKNAGKSPAEIVKLGVAKESTVYSRLRYIRAIVKGELPENPTTTTASNCRKALLNFTNRQREYLSEKTIQKLERRAEECTRRGR